jgi:hypothetical protein
LPKNDPPDATPFKSVAAKRVQAHRARARLGFRCLTVPVNDRKVRHLILASNVRSSARTSFWRISAFIGSQARLALRSGRTTLACIGRGRFPTVPRLPCRPDIANFRARSFAAHDRWQHAHTRMCVVGPLCASSLGKFCGFEFCVSYRQKGSERHWPQEGDHLLSGDFLLQGTDHSFARLPMRLSAARETILSPQ